MSLLGEKLQTAGWNRAENEFAAAVSKLWNSGVTAERGREIYDALAKRMPGRGHVSLYANTVQISHAPTRQPVEDGGAYEEVPDSGRCLVAPSSSSHRGGEGQEIDAHQRRAPIALPVREPTTAQRTAAAMVAKAAAITVLDTLRIDGRSIGDWTVAEARRLGPQKTREGIILIEATRKVANARGFQLIRDVLKAEELQIIMQKAAEISDAA